MDLITFDPEMLPETVTKDSVKVKPEDGCYVYGMYLEGARWSYARSVLDESEPKVLFTSAPCMWLKPVKVVDKRDFPAYLCPWYRTADRRGVLATTGHSSNFIGLIPLPIDKTSDHWIRRGVCLLMSLVSCFGASLCDTTLALFLGGYLDLACFCPFTHTPLHPTLFSRHSQTQQDN